MKDSLSHRSVSSVTSYVVPTKDDINQFINDYKSLDPSFDIIKLTKSNIFQVVPYKNGVYIGEYVNKQRNGLGIFITEKYIF